MTKKNDPFHLMIVKESTISGAGLGTFATQFIPKNIDLGKYYGIISKIEPVDTTYTWNILKKDEYMNEYVEFIDGTDFKENNPLRYVNGAKNEDERKLLNTVMKNQEGNIHYYTSRDIYEGEELFIDYGVNYWKHRKENHI